MSDQLFDIPSSSPDRLTTARKRVSAAQKAYDEATDDPESHISGVPIAYDQEVLAAIKALREIEAEEYEKAKRA